MTTPAKESASVVRARQRIADKIDKDNQQCTEEAISHALELIHAWKQRHLKECIPLKDRAICYGSATKKELLLLMHRFASATKTTNVTTSLKERNIRSVQKGFESLRKKNSKLK